MEEQDFHGSHLYTAESRLCNQRYCDVSRMFQIYDNSYVEAHSSATIIIRPSEWKVIGLH